ncbi:hypothetical protein LY76DRAFT_591633 [Colletotrichum caudatum]|nr:hypothetical protein LY76DRAFT_591633 [Colletotrichum caudatum]
MASWTYDVRLLPLLSSPIAGFGLYTWQLRQRVDRSRKGPKGSLPYLPLQAGVKVPQPRRLLLLPTSPVHGSPLGLGIGLKGSILYVVSRKKKKEMMMMVKKMMKKKMDRKKRKEKKKREEQAHTPSPSPFLPSA